MVQFLTGSKASSSPCHYLSASQSFIMHSLFLCHYLSSLGTLSGYYVCALARD